MINEIINPVTKLRYITHLDGSIEFPHRGSPPKNVEGYTVDPGDPFHFHLILPECPHRTFKKMVLKCCPEGKTVRHCTKFGFLAMSAQTCIGCVDKGYHIAGDPPVKSEPQASDDKSESGQASSA